MDFTGDWHGWRLRGRHLVSPDGQRITRERLTGLLWRDQTELRLAGFANRRAAEAGKLRNGTSRQLVKVVVVDLADFRENGASAG
jgi:hypothetical protein